MSSEAIIALIILGLTGIIGVLAFVIQRQKDKIGDQLSEARREVLEAETKEIKAHAETTEAAYRGAVDRYSLFRERLRRRQKGASSSSSPGNPKTP